MRPQKETLKNQAFSLSLLLGAVTLSVLTGACSGGSAGGSGGGGSSSGGGGSGKGAGGETETMISPLSFDGITAVDQVTGGSARLNWSHIPGAAAYNVFDVSSGGSNYLATVAAPGSSYTVSGLSPSTNYTYRVRLLDADGKVDTNTNDAEVTTSNLTLPDMIANLAFWVAADDLNGNGDGNLGWSDSDPVDSWKDKSPGAHNGVQATASLRPQFKTNQIGGKPAIVFDGTDDYLGITIDIPESGYSFVVVFQSTDTGGAFLAAVDPVLSNGGSHDRQFGFRNPGKIGHRVWNEETTQSTNSYNDGEPHFAIVTVGPSGGHKVYVDGVQVASGSKTASDFNWQSGIVMGYHTAWGAFQGQIAEVMIYGKELSAQDQQDLATYFSSRYGI